MFQLTQICFLQSMMFYQNVSPSASNKSQNCSVHHTELGPSFSEATSLIPARRVSLLVAGPRYVTVQSTLDFSWIHKFQTSSSVPTQACGIHVRHNVIP